MPMSENSEVFEDLFKDMRQLRSKDEAGDCKEFGDEVVSGWYRARDYVLSKLDDVQSWGSDGIAASSSERVHIVIDCVDPMAFYIARHAALALHFPNFNEGDGRSQAPRNGTLITLLYNRKNIQTSLLNFARRSFWVT